MPSLGTVYVKTKPMLTRSGRSVPSSVSGPSRRLSTAAVDLDKIVHLISPDEIISARKIDRTAFPSTSSSLQQQSSSTSMASLGSGAEIRVSQHLMEKKIMEQYQSDKHLEETTDMFSSLSCSDSKRSQELPPAGLHVVQEETCLNMLQDRDQRQKIKRILSGKYGFPLYFRWQYKLHHCIHRGNYGFTLFGEFNSDKVKLDVALKFVSKTDTGPQLWTYDMERGCEVPLELAVYQKNDNPSLPHFHDYVDLPDYGVVVTRTHGTLRQDKRWYQDKFNTVNWDAHMAMKH